MPTPIAVGLDLGSTLVKAGVLDDRGTLTVVASAPAPPLTGSGLIRECDPAAYLDAARSVVTKAAAHVPKGTSLGIASQRSSFVIWNKRTGRALTPLVSWQDRRAAPWCAAHVAIGDEVTKRTGLPLSAHYVGPKLAAQRDSDPRLGDALDSGDALFGNLDSYWLWTENRESGHVTDLSMAARTLLADITAGAWSPALLARFGVPRDCLPTILPTVHRRGEIAGLRLAASLSDQAAGALAVLGSEADDALVTLGTGAFVLHPGDVGTRLPGYLTAPILGTELGVARAVLEGTINGSGAALDVFPIDPSPLPEHDPAPEAFCIPDVSGLGSPYWRPTIGLTFSDAATALDPAARGRIVLEGLVFRVRQVLEDLQESAHPGRVLLSGGVTSRADLPLALAVVLEREVEVLLEREAGLLGAARLAAGLEPYGSPATRIVRPERDGAYLGNKYPAWRRWLAGILT